METCVMIFDYSNVETQEQLKHYGLEFAPSPR